MSLSEDEKSALLSAAAAGELSFDPRDFYVDGKP